MVFACPFEDCDKSFVKKSKLEIHVRSHTGERPFVCTECPKSFGRADHLRRHVLLSHSPSDSVPMFKCTVDGCGSEFKLKYHLNRHIKTHESPASFKCTAAGCDQRFPKKSLLRAHVASEHISHEEDESSTTLKAYVCDRSGCGKCFDSPSELKYHVLAVHDVGSRYICGHPDCIGQQVHFDTKKELRRHTEHVHKPSYECDQCSRSFTKKSNLRLHHRLKHSSSSSTPAHKCNICHQEFERKSYLKKHVKRIHRKTSVYKCTKCGSEFSTRGSLTRHNQNVDCMLERSHDLQQIADPAPVIEVSVKEQLTGFAYSMADRPHSCPIENCKYAFTREYDLMRHLRSDAHGQIPLVNIQDFEWMCYDNREELG